MTTDIGRREDSDGLVLFSFDDFALPFRHNVKLQLNGFVQGISSKSLSNVVLGLGPDGAPDDRFVTGYATVAKVGNELWMWYCAKSNLDFVDNEHLCLAVSNDGKHWKRPNLGVSEFNGSRNNNRINIPVDNRIQSCVVFHEPDELDPTRRFKMSFESRRFNSMMAVAFSDDGINWLPHPENPVGPWFEQSGGVRFNGVYFVNGQGKGHWAQTGWARSLETYASYDFDSWSQASCVGFRRDPLPPRQPEFGDHSGKQVHLGAALWNRGNILIGFYGMWNGHPTNDRRLTSMDIGMVVSHDGFHFREPVPDFPIVSAAEIGWRELPEGNAAVHFPALIQAQGFENIGDETLFWYSPWPERDSDGIHVASWSKDRLGYLQTVSRERENAFVVSQPIYPQGQAAKLFLNVDGLSEHAKISVSVLNKRFEPLPEYRGREIEVSESGFRVPVRWEGADRITARVPMRIKLDFSGLRSEDARLYAVYFTAV